ncbi:MAG: glucose 1-dehydrogenase [Anaerolineales bacterium]|nr:glucose 1-dehydrogenase [Anaerolineales bacterium]
MKEENSTSPEVSYNFLETVVLVTGSGGGIGSSIAAVFSRSGANVALHYNSSREKALHLAEELSPGGKHAAAFQANLCREEEVRQMISRIVSRFGRLDVLVNNAGIFPSAGLLEMKPADWETMIDTNLRSVFLCTQAAGKQMAAQGNGVIINITSIEANHPGAGHAHYSTSKAGVLMLTRASANELGPLGIRVNAIAPGLINRTGLEEAWPEGVASYRKYSPLGTLGEPEDVAHACLFLASPAAKWITGTCLTVDGGISNRPLI